MSERFIKYKPGPKAQALKSKNVNAFHLLFHIAQKVARKDEPLKGLKAGECFLGNWKEYGLTERQYRTAKKDLIEFMEIEIVETCRTRKSNKRRPNDDRSVVKMTTEVTTVGTKVKLISSDIWELNIESKDDRKDDRTTTARQKNDDEQEYKNIRNKEEKEKINKKEKLSQKKSYREFVFLTEEEFAKLSADHPADFVNAMLDELNSYKGSTGKEYKSDYHTMTGAGWVLKKVKNPPQQSSHPQGKPKVDRRTQNQDGTPVSSPADEIF